MVQIVKTPHPKTQSVFQDYEYIFWSFEQFKTMF
jgi:hypothetical protein